MNDKDFEVLYFGSLLRASKSKTYRDSITKYFHTMIVFFQENDLFLHEMLAPGKVPHEEFAVMRSDLTNEGYELVKHGLDKWTKKVTNPDSGIPVEDTSILERELAKIRGKQ